MSNVLDRVGEADTQSEEHKLALAFVASEVLSALGPKQRKKIRAALTKRADELEQFEGCRFPANVSTLWDYRRHGKEMARASEAQRQERLRQAEAIRAVIGKVF